MSWREPDDLDAGEQQAGRWPLAWHGLYPRERWMWFERLWTDACALRARYRLALRSRWWEDEVQVEALAALAAWIRAIRLRRVGRPARKAGAPL